MDNPQKRRRSARLRSQSVVGVKYESDPIPASTNDSSTIGKHAKQTTGHVRRPRSLTSPPPLLTNSYVITPRGGVKRKAVERPLTNRKIIVRTSTPKPASVQSDSVQEVFHDNLVRIQYVQHRDQQTGCTSREVNIDFADDAECDAQADNGDGVPAGAKGRASQKRKRTKIVIKTVPVN